MVVNEELEEDNDFERTINLRRLNFSNISFDDDLPSKFKLDTINTSICKNSRSTNPANFSINMDLVLEVKEEENTNSKFEKNNSILLNSPRIRYLTDMIEDSAINSPNYMATNTFKKPNS